MIIARTPLRVSFFGGGTDYPDHFREHGGQTLGVAIDKYSYITVNSLAPLFEYACRVSYSRTELVNRIDEIQHPAVRESLRLLGVEGALDIHYVGDLPARSGLGSSSSFTVTLLNALRHLRGEVTSHAQLARDAVHVERDMCGERVGVQDQYICAHGGLIHLSFGTDGVIHVNRPDVTERRLALLESRLMLFYTGLQRQAHQVLEEQLSRTQRGEIRGQLGDMAALVNDGLSVLTGNGPIDRFGELLHDAWLLKRGLSTRISTSAIDDAYESALRAGAIGGKLLGAGGGGFLLLFARPEQQDSIECALSNMPRIDFRVDYSGASILFQQPRRRPFVDTRAPTATEYISNGMQ